MRYIHHYLIPFYREHIEKCRQPVFFLFTTSPVLITSNQSRAESLSLPSTSNINALSSIFIQQRFKKTLLFYVIFGKNYFFLLSFENDYGTKL